MKQKIKLKIEGGFRKAGVMVESEGFSFRKGGEVEKEIELETPEITLYYSVRGGKFTQFNISLTINEITHSISGTVKSAKQAESDDVDFDFSDFNLPVA